MGMDLLNKIRAKTGLKNYAISPMLRDKHGVEITIQGLDCYNKPEARSMRLDVLCGLRKVAGITWAEFGRWLDEEFLKGKE